MAKKPSSGASGGPSPTESEGLPSSEPGGAGLTESEGLPGSEPGGTGLTESEGLPGSEPGGTGLTESEGSSGNEPGDADMAESEGLPSSEPGGTALTESEGLSGSEPGGTGLTESQGSSNSGSTSIAEKTDPEKLEWFRASDDVRTGVIQGVTFGPKKVEYSAIDGLAIFEGDIVLGKVEDIEGQLAGVDLDQLGTTELASDSDIAHAVAITGSRYRWPGGVIPYEIASSVSTNTRTIIEDAIDHWHQNTLLRLKPRNGEQNYVRFISGDGCYSSVGMVGNRQDISIGAGCGFGAAVHEIGHAFGLWHEQSREDRNDHVTINWQNIESGREHNFNQHITDGDDINNYDYGSIMHYGAYAFSKNNKPTIVTKDGEAIGQRNGLSAADIAATRTMYPPHTITKYPHLRYSALWNSGTHAQVWWPLCTEQQFRQKTSDLWSTMRVKQMHAVVLDGAIRYACLWNPGTYGQVWWPNCSEQQFRDLTAKLWSWARPAQVQAFVVGNQIRYSCIWNAGTHGQVWWPNCSEQQFRDMTAKLWSWARPAQVQAFVVGNQIRYSCLWNAGTHGQVWWPNCSEQQFRDMTAKLWSWARPAQVQAFKVGNQLRYSCLWNAGTHGQLWWPLCTEEDLRLATSKGWSSRRPAQWYPVAI